MRAAAARRIAGWAAGQAALTLLIILLVSLCTPLHLRLLRGTGAARRTGLPDAEIAQIATAMTSSMRGGGEDALRAWFTEEETAHMRDVRGLVLLGWRAAAVCAAVWALGMASSRGLDARTRKKCARAALAIVLVPAAAAAVAFAADFSGTFVLFHRLFFRGNTLWLMDPRVHRMVVIYNEAFFTRAVAVIGGACLASLMPLVRAAARGRR